MEELKTQYDSEWTMVLFVSKPLYHTKTLCHWVIIVKWMMLWETRNSHHISPWLEKYEDKRIIINGPCICFFLLRPTLWLSWFLHKYLAVMLAPWQPEKQRKSKCIGKDNYKVEQLKKGFKEITEKLFECVHSKIAGFFSVNVAKQIEKPH